MAPIDKPVFASALLGMGELYDRELSEAAIQLWWHALESHPIEAITRAFAAHMSDPDRGRWMPKPADILQHIAGGPTEDLAAIAWTKVERAIRSVGAYQTVVFDDPVIMMTLRDLGNWRDLCGTSEDEMPFRAKEFQRLYTAYQRHPKGEYPRALPGIAEAVNELAGYEGMAPVLIGNRQKALEIWHSGKGIGAIDMPTRTVWQRIEQIEHTTREVSVYEKTEVRISE